MTMQPRPTFTIADKKAETRRYARNGALTVAGGVGGGLVLSVLMSSSFFLILGCIIAVAGGAYFGLKVKKNISA